MSQTETDSIEQYRYDELRNMGVSAEDANVLCERSDIIHQLKDLVDQGCPIDVAVRITR